MRQDDDMNDSATDQLRPAARAHQGRRAVISREDLMAAAMELVGPNRSISTLSLREVAREAGIAPNSFYRHFRDVDELAVALIEQAGSALRQVIGEARNRAITGRSVVRGSVEAFMEQLWSEQKYMQLLLREGMVGSEAFKSAVDRQLVYFEEELCVDLVRLAAANKTGIVKPDLVARAITRLVFAMGATALDLPMEKRRQAVEDLIIMVRMIVVGTQSIAEGRAGIDS
jgi:TetR/AcrR family transcriptional regulator, fatty acid biosynthesis regulator